MTNYILLIFATITFTAYIVYVYRKHGVLLSISASYYKIKNDTLFTLVLWSFAFPVIIVGNSLSLFFAGAGIIFVGAAAATRFNMYTKIIHNIGAIIGVAGGVAAFSIHYDMWWWSVLMGFTFIIIRALDNRTYVLWIEVFTLYYTIIGLWISILS